MISGSGAGVKGYRGRGFKGSSGTLLTDFFKKEFGGRIRDFRQESQFEEINARSE
jgi:hypothetical protein